MTGLLLLGISLAALYLLWQVLRLVFSLIDYMQAEADRLEDVSATEGTETSAKWQQSSSL